MQFSISSLLFLLAPLAVSATGQGDGSSGTGTFVYNRLNASEAVLLIVDLQVGLFSQVRDQTPEAYRNQILAHTEVGKLFNIPTILTTSAETGPNGPLPKEILAMHPNAPLIQRQGEVNAWDSPEFRAAVEATGRKQVILAGITTDVCAAFLALSLRAEGYDVWHNTDASGTFNRRIADEANVRMRGAGVQTIGLFAIVTELMRDWRNTPGASTVLPSYGYLARAHAAAQMNGTLIPGEAGLV
jgi:nicotinamidase-related amidase